MLLQVSSISVESALHRNPYLLFYELLKPSGPHTTTPKKPVEAPSPSPLKRPLTNGALNNGSPLVNGAKKAYTDGSSLVNGAKKASTDVGVVVNRPVAGTPLPSAAVRWVIPVFWLSYGYTRTVDESWFLWFS